MKKKDQTDTYKDPVCGMMVSRLSAPAACRYDGRTYYFCAEVCQKKFEENPAQYIAKWPRKGQ